MHLFVAFLSIVAVIYKKDYLVWKKFYPTMQYIALGNLTYNFLCANHWLWRLVSEIDFFNHSLLEVFYTFVAFPPTALMFLSRYPEGKGFQRILIHYLFWIGLYVGFEYIFREMGNIKYDYGWGLGWSAIFDCIMFPFLRMHYKKPLLTLLLSVPMAIFWVLLFDVPVNIPIGER